MLRKVKTIYNQLRYILDRRQKLELLGVLLLIVFTTVVELVGVTIIFPFIQILIDYDSIQETKYLQFAYNALGTRSPNEFIIFLAVVFILVYLFKNIFIVLSYNYQYSFTFKNQDKIALRLLKCYMGQPYSFHLNHSSAELIRNINNDISMMFQAILALLGLLAEAMVCLALGVYLLFQDFLMTVIVAGVLLIFMLLYVKRFKNYLVSIGDEDRKYSMGIVKWLQQSFNGLKEAKIMHREAFFVDSFQEQYDKWANLEKTYRTLQMVPKPIMEFLSIAAIMVAIIIKVISGTDMAAFVGVISVFAVAAFRLLPSFNRITGYISAVAFYYPSFDAVYNELRQIDGLEKQNIETSDIRSMEFNTSIDVDSLSFRYPQGDKDVLTDLKMSIPKNSSVAFIGPSGAGKTTLADILLGVLRPTKGAILIDGKDMFDNLYAWQKKVGYIPQSIYLMDDTIRNNILYGAVPDPDDKNMMRAIEEAQLGDFIKSLPDGLDTEIGEGGVRLSGGQRQRIGIARALYNNPDVLVLDEATSALDGDTERAVMESIDTLSGSKTLIIIAHRLATVKNCDIKYEVSNSKARQIDKEEFERILLRQTESI